MRRTLLLFLAIMLALASAACGGNNAVDNREAQPATINNSESTIAPTAEAEAAEATETMVTEAPDSEPESITEGEADQTATSDDEVTKESAAEAAIASGPVATAEASGLTINPDPVVPGEPYIILGTIINVSMIPVDAPQFFIEGDNGVSYRVNAQAVADIFVEDGSQLLPHEFRPGLRVIATALLVADASASDVAATDDLVILLDPQ